MEWTLKRVAVSPHSSSTRPPATIITAAVLSVAAYVRTSFSLSADQPSCSADGARVHVLSRIDRRLSPRGMDEDGDQESGDESEGRDPPATGHPRPTRSARARRRARWAGRPAAR